MTDLGLHGFPARPDGVDWISHAHAVLDGLPDVFSTVWLSDHLQVDADPAAECWTQLTWLAATFPKLRVGSLVMSQSYRNPGLLGVMAQTLQKLSGGRLIVGLGAGWLEEEYRAFDFDYPSGGTRVAQLAEVIELPQGTLVELTRELLGRVVPARPGALRTAGSADPDPGRDQWPEGSEGRCPAGRLVDLGWSLGLHLSGAVRAPSSRVRGHRPAVEEIHLASESERRAARGTRAGSRPSYEP